MEDRKFPSDSPSVQIISESAPPQRKTSDFCAFVQLLSRMNKAEEQDNQGQKY